MAVHNVIDVIFFYNFLSHEPIIPDNEYRHINMTSILNKFTNIADWLFLTYLRWIHSTINEYISFQVENYFTLRFGV